MDVVGDGRALLGAFVGGLGQGRIVAEELATGLATAIIRPGDQGAEAEALRASWVRVCMEVFDAGHGAALRAADALLGHLEAEAARRADPVLMLPLQDTGYEQ